MPQPCLLSHLYCTCGKFVLYRSTAVSGDIYEKPPNFENNTSLPTAKHGSLAQAAEVASSFPCAEVGPSPLFFLTGSYTQSLSTKAAVSASALRNDFIIIFLREKGPKE